MILVLRKSELEHLKKLDSNDMRKRIPYSSYMNLGNSDNLFFKYKNFLITVDREIYKRLLVVDEGFVIKSENNFKLHKKDNGFRIYNEFSDYDKIVNKSKEHYEYILIIVDDGYKFKPSKIKIKTKNIPVQLSDDVFYFIDMVSKIILSLGMKIVDLKMEDDEIEFLISRKNKIISI